jgi:hypothetical protein
MPRQPGGNRTPGASRAPLHDVWAALKRRRSNKPCSDSGDYGGQGISVQARWLRLTTFLEDMGPRQ